MDTKHCPLQISCLIDFDLFSIDQRLATARRASSTQTQPAQRCQQVGGGQQPRPVTAPPATLSNPDLIKLCLTQTDMIFDYLLSRTLDIRTDIRVFHNARLLQPHCGVQCVLCLSPRVVLCRILLSSCQCWLLHAACISQTFAMRHESSARSSGVQLR